MNLYAKVPLALWQDWQSRGLIDNWTADGCIRTGITMRGKSHWVVASTEVMRGLVADAEWLCDPAMGSDQRLKTACKKFITNIEPEVK